MTQQEVNRLIDKYMEGKTSLEEERQLAIEVNRPDAPAEWKIVAEMLGELTLGEALYDQEMEERKRVRLHRYIGWSVAAVAACLTLWFVLGKFSTPTPQQDMTPQIAQQPTQMVKPEVPEEKEVPPVVTSTSLAVEQVAYNPPAKRVKKHRRPARPAVEVVEQEELPVLIGWHSIFGLLIIMQMIILSKIICNISVNFLKRKRKLIMWIKSLNF